MLVVTLYTRSGCGLCEQVKADLEALREQFPHQLVEVDIDSDPALQRTYLLEIPVVEIGPYRLKAPIDRKALAMTLGAASDRRSQLVSIDQGYAERVRRGQTLSGLDRLSIWFSRHYLAVLNLLLIIYLGLPLLAPALMRVGATGPARVIYAIYKPVCHQLGFRSWFLFGEQAFYPRAAADIPGLQTFEQVTGITDQTDPYHLDARNYLGDEALGYKIALCERDVAIYGAMIVFGLLYAATGRRIKPLSWLVWILIGMGPVGLDGFSQLFSQLNLDWLAWLPFRESTPFLRTLTGALFGFMTAWFAFPQVELSMQESRQFLLKKKAISDTTRD